MKKTESTEPTPEQLLQILNLQLEQQRSQRGASSRNRAVFLVGGLLFIVIGAGIALIILDQMLADLPTREAAAPQTSSVEPSGNF